MVSWLKRGLEKCHSPAIFHTDKKTWGNVHEFQINHRFLMVSSSNMSQWCGFSPPFYHGFYTNTVGVVFLLHPAADEKPGPQLVFGIAPPGTGKTAVVSHILPEAQGQRCSNRKLVGGLEQVVFPYVENNHPNWLIFSEGLKPPTRRYSYGENGPNWNSWYSELLYTLPRSLDV